MPRSRPLNLTTLPKHFDLKEVQKAFEMGDANQQLDWAFDILELDKQKYLQTATPALKEDYLQYKYLKKEFEYIKKSLEKKSGISDDDANKWISLFEKAYLLLSKSELTTRNTSSYSPFSKGLSDFDAHNVTKQKTAEKEDLNQSVYAIGTKDVGVASGFKAIQTKDVLFTLLKKFPDREARKAYIKSKDADIKLIHNEMKDELPRYLVKLTGEANGDKVEPEEKNLKQTKQVSDVYKKNELLGDIYTQVYKLIKTDTVTNINIEAVLEVLGNDLARVFGMIVQDQVIYPSLHKNGLLKVMPKAAWIDGATTFEDAIAGSEEDKNENYYVRPVFSPADGIEHISNDSIRRLGEYLPLLSIQGDRDAIGSKGQNKLRMKDADALLLYLLIGIDFGHVYQLDILNKISPDFHVHNKDFKNYSLFYDSLRHDFIRGLIKIARIGGQFLNEKSENYSLHERIAKSYGEDFFNEVKNMTPHADELIFDDYIKKFEELKKEFSTSQNTQKDKNINCCNKIIEELKATKIKAIKNRDEFVRKFENYLTYTQEEVNLLENLEKAAAGETHTSLRSSDKKVLLNHLRITNDAFIPKWASKSTDDAYFFTAAYKDSSTAKTAMENIRNLISTNSLFLKCNNNELTIAFPKKHLAYFEKELGESNLKHIYHTKDYELYQRYLQERILQDDIIKLFADFKLEASWLKDKKLRLQFKSNTAPDPILIGLLLKKGFSIEPLPNEHELIIDFKKEIDRVIVADPLKDIYLQLKDIAQETEEQKILKEQFDVFKQNVGLAQKTSQFGNLSLKITTEEQYIILNFNKTNSHEKDTNFEKILKRHLNLFAHENNIYQIELSKITALNTLWQKSTQSYDILQTMKSDIEVLMKEETDRIKASSLKKREIKKEQQAEGFSKIKNEIDSQLNRFKQIQNEIANDVDLHELKIELTPIEKAENAFQFNFKHIDADIDEKFKTIFKQGLKDATFLNENSFRIETNHLENFNSSLIAIYTAFDEKRTKNIKKIQHESEHLLKTITKLSSTLNREDALSKLKYPAIHSLSLFSIDMPLTAPSVKHALDVFLNSNTKFTTEELTKLLHLLEKRQKHIQTLDKNKHKAELEQLASAITISNFLLEQPPSTLQVLQPKKSALKH